jgi:hypothetical protein
VTIPLPSPLPTASGWQVVDNRLVKLQSQPAAGGLATITFDQLATDEMWLVDQMVVLCDSTTPTTMRLYENSVTPTSIRSGSDRANFDEGEWAGGLLVRPGTSLVAQWGSCSDGAHATLTLQARILRKS